MTHHNVTLKPFFITKVHPGLLIVKIVWSLNRFEHHWRGRDLKGGCRESGRDTKALNIMRDIKCRWVIVSEYVMVRLIHLTTSQVVVMAAARVSRDASFVFNYWLLIVIYLRLKDSFWIGSLQNFFFRVVRSGRGLGYSRVYVLTLI